MGNSINRSETIDFYLEQLLDKNHLEPVEKLVWDRLVVIHSGNYYLMNSEIEKTIEAAYYYLLQREIVIQKYYLRESLKENFRIIPDGKKDRIKILKRQIKQEGKVLHKCLGEINISNNEEGLKEKWRKVIASDLISLIHFIAFELVKGKIKKLSVIVETLKQNYLIDINSLEGESAKREFEKYKIKSHDNFVLWVHELFPCKIQPVLTALSCFGNIAYLKKLVAFYSVKSEVVSSYINRDLMETKDPDESVFYSGIPISFAEQYFEVLTNKSNSNREPLLSKEKVEMFIEKAFKGNQLIGKLAFNTVSGRRGEIVEIFFKFYEQAIAEYDFRKNIQDDYIKLLSENFIGFKYGTFNFRKKSR